MVIAKKDLHKKHKTKVLNHLGLVAGMCEEIGIADLINTHIPNESADKILSVGHAVVGMLLNGLGYVNKRLYLVPHFFKNKPVDKLLGVSYLKSEHFNDDALGRSLDALYDYGLSELYAIISKQAVEHLAKKYGLKIESGQLDNTNFHLHGGEKELHSEENGEVIIKITRGHSKDHRPDLVQIGLQLIVENQSRIPLLMNILSGNMEEGKSYGLFVKNHVAQLQNDYGLRLLVVDSKLYNPTNLELLREHDTLQWITRVPNSLNAVKDVVAHIDKDEFEPLPGYEDYSYQMLGSWYGETQQRWLVLHSGAKYKRDLKQLNKRLIRQTNQEQKAYKKLAKQDFDTKEAALEASKNFCSSLKYSHLSDVEIHSKKHYEKTGRPSKNEQPQKITYCIEATISWDLDTYKTAKGQLGYFILATNELEETQMSPQEILAHYKKQASVERSFRFLKDPNIVGSSLFVQKPERMMALVMIMTLCLLVYAALEYKTRTLLKNKNLTFKNQIGKPIQNPTMRWIFECFEGIHILYSIDNKPLVLNLDDNHLFILNLFGENYWKYYT